MKNRDPFQRMEDIQRINEFGVKAGQVLLFLSFALVSIATLKDKDCSRHDLRCAMLLWTSALFPVVLSILPLKEFAKYFEYDGAWYSILCRVKFVLMWLTLGLIFAGAVAFIRAVSLIF